MNITITLNAKQSNSLNKRAQLAGKTPEEFLAQEATSLSSTWAREDYLTSAHRLIGIAQNLPQEELDALILSIEQAAS